ncbi:MAG TPA: response regulator [Microcoleaceae bacterium UBA11344]|nr:response regulator [Microcoleaceae cyanobacterium UBA11344]
MKNTNTVKPREILLIEDSPSDADLTREALSQGTILNNLHFVEDGVEAIKFLRKKEPYVSVPRPNLILLDLNLPKKNGLEVLAEIKTDPNLKLIPVVIFSNSAAPEDIIKSYSLHANCYITKPVDFLQFTKVVRLIEEFWLAVVQLPVA